MRIRTRMLLAFLVVVSVSFYAIVNLVTREIRPRYLESMEESLVDTATLLASHVELNLKGDKIQVASLRTVLENTLGKKLRAKIYSVVKTQITLRIYMIDVEGKVIFDSLNGESVGADFSKWNDVIHTMRGEYGARSTRADESDPSSSVLHISAPIRSDSKIVGVLTVAKPVDSVTPFIEGAQRRIFLIGSLVSLAAAGVALLISFWLTRPITRLTDYALAVSDGRRVPAPRLGGGEVGALGDAFEQMRDALEGKKYVEQYIQTLTHEIKSPLTGIQGAAELLAENPPEADSKKFLGNIREGAERIELLVDRLLELAALESKKRLDKTEIVDLSALLNELGEAFESQVAQKEIRWNTKIQKEVRVVGDPFLLRQAISNVIQNALDFSPSGGSIVVGLLRDSGFAVLKVQDEGPGFPEYAKARLFEKFFSLPRPQTGKKSSGLGLSFVQEVCVLHGGRIELVSKTPNGVIARFYLPIA